MLKPDAQREQIIELLEHEGGVTEESVRKVSQATGVPEADIWGTGKFYTRRANVSDVWRRRTGSSDCRIGQTMRARQLPRPV